uniref:Fatty acid hydroxylase domain-containing protein n=1 Tax=Oxyrrhis marina TaxID=2969 RepID=A0A7S3UIH3_OXYMA
MDNSTILEESGFVDHISKVYSFGLGFHTESTVAGDLPPLPPVVSKEFLALCALSLLGPYLFCCATYMYHFHGLKVERAKMRTRTTDIPLEEHRNDWRTALGRPEGISAVVGFLVILVVSDPVLGLASIVPAAMKDLTPQIKPLVLLGYFALFDFLMWCIHFCQHYWPWLYHHTHDQHHKIKSPTIVVALTGYLPDTCVLIIVPLYATLRVIPCGNFVTVFMFASMALWHLHMIHSEFMHPWDPILQKLGLVTTHDHHVHHLRPRKNLAHFFSIYDKMFGTYVDPSTCHQLLQRDKKA